MPSWIAPPDHSIGDLFMIVFELRVRMPTTILRNPFVFTRSPASSESPMLLPTR